MTIMQDWAILFILCGEVFILSRLDRVLFGTLLTPFNLLSIPYVVVVVLAFFFAPTFGFVPLYMESVLVWVVGLAIFWLGGLYIRLLMGMATRARRITRQSFLYEQRSENLVLLLAWICIVVMFYGFVVSLNSVGGIQGITTTQFAKIYGSGWSGHAMVFSLSLLIYLIGIVQSNKKIIQFTIVVIFIMLFAYQVKSWIILPLVGGLVYRVLSGRLRISVKKMAFFLFLGYCIFNITYLIHFGVRDIALLSNTNTYESLLRHFWFYIFAGVLAFGEVFHTGVARIHSDSRVIFTPFWNMYALVASKDLISNIGQISSQVDSVRSLSTNINTLFGTLIIYLGYWGSAIYTVCLGVFSYMLFAFSRLTRNCWMMVLWSFVAAMLAFGWFEFYFWHLTVIEVAVYCLLLTLLSLPRY